MSKIFDISEQYSKALTEARGPESKLRLARAWAVESAGRRSMFRLIGAGVFLGALGIVFSMKSKVSSRVASVGEKAEKAAG